MQQERNTNSRTELIIPRRVRLLPDRFRHGKTLHANRPETEPVQLSSWRLFAMPGKASEDLRLIGRQLAKHPPFLLKTALRVEIAVTPTKRRAANDSTQD
jgi:hypothetical protein